MKPSWSTKHIAWTTGVLVLLFAAGVLVAKMANQPSSSKEATLITSCVPHTGQHCKAGVALATTSTTCVPNTGQHCQASTSTTTPTTSTAPTTTVYGPDLTVPPGSSWTCSGPVALGKVTVDARGSSGDSVTLECSGDIGDLEITGGAKDGIKVHGLAHDLTIHSGALTCLNHSVGSHQDGIQVMGSDNVTFENFDSDCVFANNAGLFINSANGSGGITNFHYNGGEVHGQNCGQVVTIGNSTDSGINGVSVYDTKIRINAGAVRPINTGTAFLGC